MTINGTTYGDTTAAACYSFDWYEHTGIATSTEALTHTLVGANQHGCDSTVTLHLTINYSSTGDTTATECDSLIWYDGPHTATGNYTYTFTAGNANGCDSTVTLHLTVNYSTQTTVTDSADGSYLWHDSIYTESGTYMWQGSTAAGCDSVVTLILVINHVGIQAIGDNNIEVTVHPNPTTGQLTIDADDVQAIEVYDMAGRKIATYKNTNSIDLSNQPTGNYTLKIHLTKGSSVQKVILR